MSAGVERTEITRSCLETGVLFLVRCKKDAWFFVSESHTFERAFAINFDCVWLARERWWYRWVSQGLSEPN